MGTPTALEENFNVLICRAIRRMSGKMPEVAQGIIDEITEELVRKTDPAEILRHMQEVYDKTADTYANLPEHRMIPDALPTFMCAFGLKEGSRILDLGSGPLLRDTLYMSCGDEAFRREAMGRMRGGRALRDRMATPRVTFEVEAADSSERMVALAQRERDRVTALLMMRGVPHKLPIVFKIDDMHNVSTKCKERYDGIWSSAALFTHTPRIYVGMALRSVAEALKPGGVFGVTFPNAGDRTPYDSILMSRSGELKYFSRPAPWFIVDEARMASLTFLAEEYNDLTRGDEVTKDFFVAQFYRKG